MSLHQVNRLKIVTLDHPLLNRQLMRGPQCRTAPFPTLTPRQLEQRLSQALRPALTFLLSQTKNLQILLHPSHTSHSPLHAFQSKTPPLTSRYMSGRIHRP